MAERFIPRAQEIYRHFKGDLYQVLAVAEHTETGEELVVYQAMYGDFQVYVRPLDSFMEEIDREKYPNAAGRYRFELMGAQDAAQETAERIDTEWQRPAQEPPKEEKVAEPVVHVPDEQQEIQEELNIDPLVLQFLDADSYEQ